MEKYENIYRNDSAFGLQSQNRGSVMRNDKGATKAYATRHNSELAWPQRYHVPVIASGRELDRVRKYIQNSPVKRIEKKT